jgi:hypothetical protein
VKRERERERGKKREVKFAGTSFEIVAKKNYALTYKICREKEKEKVLHCVSNKTGNCGEVLLFPTQFLCQCN